MLQSPIQKSSAELIEECQKVVNKSQVIIDGLENNGAWEAVLEDIQGERQRLDDTWQYVSDKDKWQEYRVTKMAVMKILNLVSEYKTDKEQALEEIEAIANPEDKIVKDVENE